MGACIEKQCTGQGALNLLQRPARDDLFRRASAQVVGNHVIFLVLFVIGGFYFSHFLVATPYDQVMVDVNSFQELDALGSRHRLKCPCSSSPRLTVAQALPTLSNMTDSTLFSSYCVEFASGMGQFGSLLCDRYSAVFVAQFQSLFTAEVRLEASQQALASQVRAEVVSACQSSVLFLAERDKSIAGWRAFQEREGLIQPSPLGTGMFEAVSEMARNISEHMASGCVSGPLHTALVQELTPSREALYELCQCTSCSYVEYQAASKIVLESLNKAFVFAILLSFCARIFVRAARWCCTGAPLPGDGVAQKMWNAWVHETSGEHGEFNLGGVTTTSVSMTHKCVILWNNIVFVLLLLTLAGLLYVKFSGPRAWLVEDVPDVTVERFNQEPAADETAVQCECRLPAYISANLVDSTFSDPDFTYESCLNHTIRVTADIADYLAVLGIPELEPAYQVPIFTMCALYHTSVQSRMLPLSLKYKMASLPRETQYANMSRDYFNVVGDYDELVTEYEANEFWSFFGVSTSGFDTYDVSQEYPNILKVFKFQGLLKLLLLNSLLPEVATEVIPLVEEHKTSYAELFSSCRPHQCSLVKRETDLSVLFRVFGEVIVGFGLFRQLLVFLVFLFCHSDDDSNDDSKKGNGTAATPTAVVQQQQQQQQQEKGRRTWCERLKEAYLSIWTGGGALNYLGYQTHSASTRNRRDVAINTTLLLLGVVLVVVVSLFLSPSFEEIKTDASLATIQQLADKAAPFCPCDNPDFEMDTISPQWRTSSNTTLTELCLLVAEGNETLQCASSVSWLMMAAQQQSQFFLPSYLVKPGQMVAFARDFQAKFTLLSGCQSLLVFSTSAQLWWNILYTLRSQNNLPTIPNNRQAATEAMVPYYDSRNLVFKLMDSIHNDTASVLEKSFPITDASMHASCNPPQCSYTQVRQQGLLVVETLPSLSAIFVVLTLIGRVTELDFSSIKNLEFLK